MTKQCDGCQRSFEAGSNRAKWCPDCKAGQVQAANDRYNARRDGFQAGRGDGWTLAVVQRDDDNAKTRLRLSVELTAQELADLNDLHHWLTETKAGQAAMARNGMPVSVLGTCDTTGTPTYGVPRLMFAIERARLHLGHLLEAAKLAKK